MLFAIHGPNKDLVTGGPIPAGSTLVVPAECGAHQSAVYYVYFDNPDAGEVPDFFTAKPGVLNGDMEQGQWSADPDAVPTEWVHDPADCAAPRQLDQRESAVGPAVPKNGGGRRGRAHLDLHASA